MNNKFSPYNDLKVLRWSSRLKMIQREEIPDPVMITYDMSNACNLRCKWCFNQEYIRNRETLLQDPLKHLRGILNHPRARRVRAIEFTGGGEPLANPETTAAMHLARSFGKKTCLVTNGTLLTPKICEDVVETCDFVRISLDASKPETYKKLKGGNDGDFEHVIKMVDELVQARCGRELPVIGLAFLVNPWNLHEIPDAAELASAAGVDYINFRPLFTNYPIIKEQLGYDSNKFVTEKKDEINHLIKIAKRIANGDIKIYHSTTRYGLGYRPPMCKVTPLNPVVQADGNVCVCCERRGDESLYLGSLYEDNFWDLWGTKIHRNILKTLYTANCPQKCKLNGYNEIYDRCFESGEMGWDFV